MTSKPSPHDAFLTTEEVDDEGTRALLTKMLERDYLETSIDGLVLIRGSSASVASKSS